MRQEELFFHSAARFRQVLLDFVEHIVELRSALAERLHALVYIVIGWFLFAFFVAVLSHAAK
jgi:hypothetical protein